MDRPTRNVFYSLNRRMRVRGWIGLLVVVVGALAAPSVVRSRLVSTWRAALCLRRARSDVASRAFEQARIEFRAALRLQPSNAMARSELAEMERSLGNTELAFLEYESLTEMHPESAEAWVRLAELMVKADNSGTGRSARGAIDLDPLREARLLRATYGYALDAITALFRMRGSRCGGARRCRRSVLLVRSAANSRGRGGNNNRQEAIGEGGEHPVLSSLDALIRRERRTLDCLPPRRSASASMNGRRAAICGLGARELARSDGGDSTFEDALGRHDWPEAEGIIDSARKAYPGSAFPPFLHGDARARTGKFGTSRAWVPRTMAISPRRPAILAALRAPG